MHTSSGIVALTAAGALAVGSIGMASAQSHASHDLGVHRAHDVHAAPGHVGQNRSLAPEKSKGLPKLVGIVNSNRDIEISDRTLPAGTFVTLGVGAANRDPLAFDHPDQLDITRRPNNHLAFGQGAHACSGMNVARLEGRIAIGELVRRFPKLALAGTPERDRRVRFRGLRSLPVTLY